MISIAIKVNIFHPKLPLKGLGGRLPGGGLLVRLEGISLGKSKNEDGF